MPAHVDSKFITLIRLLFMLSHSRVRNSARS